MPPAVNPFCSRGTPQRFEGDHYQFKLESQTNGNRNTYDKALPVVKLALGYGPHTLDEQRRSEYEQVHARHRSRYRGQQSPGLREECKCHYDDSHQDAHRPGGATGLQYYG